jgi:hypothetical protein
MSVATILEALIAIPGIAAAVYKFVSAVVAWYVQKQTNETLAAIADAAAFAARAQTDADRYQAAQKWRDVLSRSRYLN